MHSHLRFLTSASLIAFGSVVVAGAIGVLPALIERLPGNSNALSDVELSPSCKGEVRLPWGRTCSPQPDTPTLAARNPGTDIMVVYQPGRDHAANAEPPPPVQNTASAASVFFEPPQAVAPAQQFASAPPAAEEPTEAAAPVPQTPRMQPSVKAKPHSVKKVARREEPRERRRDEALSTVRRFGGNKVREIPLDAYAYDRVPSRIIIRPTSIQDVYYYYR